LAVTWIRGPLRSRRTFDRAAVRSVRLSVPRDHLVLDTTTEHVTLSALGTRAERRDATHAIREEWNLAESAESAAALPPRWESIVTPEGDRALVPNVATRKAQARVASIIALAAGTATLLVGRDALRDGQLAAPAAIGLVITIALAWGAIWLARGRDEWRLGSGSLTLRRRFGANVRDVFTARRLVLESSSDSDGDMWYEL